MYKIENLSLKSRFVGMILTILILSSVVTLFAQTGFSSGNNPHDSLLFDGANTQFFNNYNCTRYQLHNQVQTAVELQQNGYWHTIEDVSTV
jgi:hypothetical protein